MDRRASRLRSSRTRPVTVRAETRGGVTFDGGGASAFGGLSFEDGAHDQTWDGFNFANMAAATRPGSSCSAAYTPRRAPHHITLRNITILASCTGRATTASGNTIDHAVYFAHALGAGPHDILFEDITVDGAGNLASAFHFYHGDVRPTRNAWNVTVRRLTVDRDPAGDHPVGRRPPRHHVRRARRSPTRGVRRPLRVQRRCEIVFKDIISTGSGQHGFYSSMGTNPPGVTFTNDSFN